MSKPIKLTDELFKRIQDEFAAKVKSMKMFGGKLEYSRSFRWEGSENDRATVFMSPVAFAKMSALIQHFNSEVAWHGVVSRDKEMQNVFHITDILVYPQTVSGATVDTDQNEYQTWLYSFDDEVFNNIRMQGHSHVNMTVSPSGVDTTHQEKILSQISDEDYYIFMIWNKQYEHFVRIFDMKHNTLYETEDVDILIGSEGVNMRQFMEDAKKNVVTKTYTSSYAPTYPSRIVQTASATAPSGSGVKTKTKPKAKPGSDIGRPYWDYLRDGVPQFDDEDDGYGGLYTR